MMNKHWVKKTYCLRSLPILVILNITIVYYAFCNSPGIFQRIPAAFNTDSPAEKTTKFTLSVVQLLISVCLNEKHKNQPIQNCNSILM